MIIDSRSKVEQGPDLVLRAHPRMRILYGIDDPERGPVPDRRVRMSQVRLYSHYRFSISKLSVQHLRPVRQVLLGARGAMRSCSTSFNVHTKFVCGTAAH